MSEREGLKMVTCSEEHVDFTVAELKKKGMRIIRVSGMIHASEPTRKAIFYEEPTKERG